jgi:hypothetical protein
VLEGETVLPLSAGSPLTVTNDDGVEPPETVSSPAIGPARATIEKVTIIAVIEHTESAFCIHSFLFIVLLMYRSK